MVESVFRVFDAGARVVGGMEGGRGDAGPVGEDVEVEETEVGEQEGDCVR